MAEVITRFKLETTQYDSKLRDAAKGLTEFTHQASLAGNEFAKFTQKNVDAARAFGNISTSATNAKDKVKELVGAYNDVAKAYNNLTKEQQQSDFGKAMAESMQTLQGRIKEAKQEMNDTGGVLGQLASKFTVNIDALKLFNVGISAAKAALDVAKDAFFASEATVDEWGRTMQSAQGLYEGFLNAINNGDISGYLSRMNDIVIAAREAYNALDTLQTMKTIQSPVVSKQQLEIDRMRQMIQIGRYIKPRDGRSAAEWNGVKMKEGQLLTPDQIRILEKQLQGALQKMNGLVENEVKQSGKAIDAYYNSLAKQNGMSLQEFKKGTSTWEEFSAKIRGYEEYKKWDREARAEFARQGGRGSVNFDKSNPFAEFKKWGIFRVDKMGKNSFNELASYIKQRDQQIAQMYSNVSQSFRAINRAEGITTRQIMGSGSGGGHGGSTTTATHKVTKQEQAANKIEEAERTYAETLQKAAIRMEVGLDSTLDYKKKELSAQERLFDAYNDAYATYADHKYKEAASEAAGKIKTMAGELKSMTDTQEAVKKAARELEAAQKKLTDAETKLAEAQATGSATAIYQAQQAVNKQRGVLDRMKNGTPAPTTTTGFEAMKQTITAEVKLERMQVDETTLHTILKDAVQHSINGMDLQLSGLSDQIAKGIDIPDKKWQEIIDEYNKIRQQIGEKPIEVDLKTGQLAKDGDAATKSWRTAASAINSASGAISNIEDPGAKILSTIGQAIATVALAYSESLAQTKEKKNIWAFIAAAAAATISMVSTISQIHSSTGYAEGGIVKGNTYSGDMIQANDGTIGLNAGEVVLNKAQQGVLASQLQGAGGNINLRGIIRGEDILVVADRSARRQGKGELLFWK